MRLAGQSPQRRDRGVISIPVLSPLEVIGIIGKGEKSGEISPPHRVSFKKTKNRNLFDQWIRIEIY